MITQKEIIDNNIAKIKHETGVILKVPIIYLNKVWGTKMEKEDALKFIKKLKKQGCEAKLYEGYSGRGMFGEITFGVQSNKYVEVKSPLRVDNLGLNWLYY